MNDRDRLLKYFILTESVLELVEMTSLHDLLLRIKVYDGNLKIDYSGQMEQIAPGGVLSICCRNLARFEINRLRHGRPDLLLVKVPKPDLEAAEDGPRTIFGFEFRESSEWLQGLGEVKNLFLHLVIDTTEARLDILFEELRMPDLG